MSKDVLVVAPPAVMPPRDRGIVRDNLQWARQFLQADPDSRGVVEIGGQDLDAVVDAVERASKLAGPRGRVIFLVGHGAGSTAPGRTHAGWVQLGPAFRVNRDIVIYGPELQAQHVRNIELGRPSAASDQARLDRRGAYDAIGRALRQESVLRFGRGAGPVREVVFLTCNVGNDTGLLDLIADAWGISVTAPTRRIVTDTDPDCAGSAGSCPIRLFLEGDQPGSGTNIPRAVDGLPRLLTDQHTGRPGRSRRGGVPPAMKGAGATLPAQTRSHITSTYEFSESGILLRGPGSHQVRVLGAHREVRPEVHGAKEDMFDPRVDQALERYFAGELAPPPEDPDALEFTPEVPRLFVTDEGEALFLQRDLSPAGSVPVIPPTPTPQPCPPTGAPPEVVRWHGLLGPSVRCGNHVDNLIDGPETFRSMHAAIATATDDDHYIYLLGWILDLDVPLDVPAAGAVCPPVPGPSTIRSLFTAASSRGVEIRMMLWDQSLSSKNTDEVAFVNGLPNGAAVLDNHQFAPVLGSHHQKVLVVKGNEGLIAFCGGVDINTDRVCDISGGSGSGSGSGSSGGAGSPLHDVHARITGPAAVDLLDVFRRRWRANPDHVPHGALRGASEPVPTPTGTSLARVGTTTNMQDDGSGSRLIERTAQEILLTVIGNARRFIYIEEQYMISMCAAEAIKRALPCVEHVTILIAASELSDVKRPWEFRKRFIDHIRASPHGGKLHVFELCGPPDDSGTPTFPAHTYVHSKILVADDEVAVIGSANMNRRGWEHDSEVVTAIVGPADESTQLAKQLRVRLWAEHLGVSQASVDDPIASRGLWTSAPARRVCLYDPTRDTDGLNSNIPEDIIDPPSPVAVPNCRFHGPACTPGGEPVSDAEDQPAPEEPAETAEATPEPETTPEAPDPAGSGAFVCPPLPTLVGLRDSAIALAVQEANHWATHGLVEGSPDALVRLTSYWSTRQGPTASVDTARGSANDEPDRAFWSAVFISWCYVQSYASTDPSFVPNSNLRRYGACLRDAGLFSAQAAHRAYVDEAIASGNYVQENHQTTAVSRGDWVYYARMDAGSRVGSHLDIVTHVFASTDSQGTEHRWALAAGGNIGNDEAGFKMYALDAAGLLANQPPAAARPTNADLQAAIGLVPARITGYRGIPPHILGLVRLS